MRTASIIALMMEAVSTSETSVHFNVTTQRYIPEDYLNFMKIGCVLMALSL
jgi:hypothetical protein